MDEKLATARRQVSPAARTGFSLIELLVVIAVLLLLLGLSIPVANSVSSGLNLTRYSQDIADTLIIARQSAITRNRETECRFIFLDDNGTNRLTGVQAWVIDEEGNPSVPLSRMLVLPYAVEINPDESRSPLILDNANSERNGDFGAHGTRSYRFFRFRPDGSTDQSITTTNNFLTLQLRHDLGTPPANFAAIQVNPVTGRIRIFRP